MLLAARIVESCPPSSFLLGWSDAGASCSAPPELKERQTIECDDVVGLVRTVGRKGPVKNERAEY